MRHFALLCWVAASCALLPPAARAQPAAPQGAEPEAQPAAGATKPAAGAAKPGAGATEPAAKPAGQGAAPPPRGAGEEPGFDERLVLATGRTQLPRPDAQKASLSLHGELQLRFRAAQDLPLEPPLTAPEATTLGQSLYLYQWLRLRPQLLYGDKLKIYGEIDAPRGMIVGETTQHVSAARDSFAEQEFFTGCSPTCLIRPRALYLEYFTPIGMFRVGHQPAHWGLGLLTNDGDHPTLFGDYRRGTITERLLFATKPLGRDGPLQISLAGDLIFDDPRAELIEGDRALQLSGSVRWQTKHFDLGANGIYRYQHREQEAAGSLTPFVETLEVGVADLAGSFNAKVTGTNGYVWGQAEVVFVGGSTDFARTIEQTRSGEQEEIRAFGGAVRLGAVHVCGTEPGKRFGNVAVTVEWGYASGDANPGDGISKRFTFDQNHNVGLVLFDHVLAYKTARAATLAQDPLVVARPLPGLSQLPSEGGVFGATYFYPTVVLRPRQWLDLKAALLVAQTTADLVDPYHYGTLGDFAGYDGGDERFHDLGVELDGGIDGRIAITDSFTAQVGAEGGVLFPGSALDDGDGNELPPQFLLNAKAGLQF